MSLPTDREHLFTGMAWLSLAQFKWVSMGRCAEKDEDLQKLKWGTSAAPCLRFQLIFYKLIIKERAVFVFMYYVLCMYYVYIKFTLKFLHAFSVQSHGVDMNQWLVQTLIIAIWVKALLSFVMHKQRPAVMFNDPFSRSTLFALPLPTIV